MYIVKIAKQANLESGRLVAFKQVMAIRQAIDKAILRNNYIKYIKEEIQYFPTMEDYPNDGLRLIVWIEYRGKDIKRFQEDMWHRTLYTVVVKEVIE